MSEIDAVAAILTRELEAGPAHARIVAKEIVEKLFGDLAGADDEPIEVAADGLCAACGQAVPEYGGIAFDDGRNEIRFGGKFVRNLTGQEAGLFRMLLDAKGRVISKENILTGLYSRKFHADDEVPESKIIDVFVCKLRKKIEPLGIELGTSWGRGYFLISPEAKEAS